MAQRDMFEHDLPPAVVLDDYGTDELYRRTGKRSRMQSTGSRDIITIGAWGGAVDRDKVRVVADRLGARFGDRTEEGAQWILDLIARSL